MLFLDALRGVAALGVVCQHLYGALPEGAAPAAAWLNALMMFGSNGVAVFFVLSGCVIPYAVAEARITPGYIARFIARRFVRLDIPYWICIAAYLLAAKAMGKSTYEHVDAATLAANLFYVNFALGLDAVVTVGWTLAIEIQFYLAYLLLLAAAQQFEQRVLPGRRDLCRHLVFGLPVFVSLLWQLKVIPDPEGPDRFFLQPWLFFACGAALTWTLFQGAPRWPVAVCVVGLLVSGVTAHEGANITGAVTGIAIFAVAVNGLMGRLGSSRAAQWFGTISYSLYLLHPLVGSRAIRMLATRMAPPWSAWTSTAAFTAGLAVSVAVASLFFVVVERPSQRLARRIR